MHVLSLLFYLFLHHHSLEIAKSFLYGADEEKPLAGKKALLIVAPKEFRDEEFLEPKKAFEKEGMEVVIASTDTGEIEGMLGLVIKPNILLSNVDVDDYSAIIFVGGSGAKVYWDNRIAHKIAIEANKKKKVIGAICIAPAILANAKILKEGTVYKYPPTMKIFNNNKVKLIDEPVVVSENIVTANGPDAAKEFSEKLVELVKKYESIGAESKKRKLSR